MATTVISTNTTGPTPWVAIDLRKFGQGVGLLVTVPGGVTATVNVEVSGNDPTAPNQISPTYLPNAGQWNLHDTLQSLSASKNSSLAYPVTLVRLNPSSISGGSVYLAVVQVDFPGVPLL